MGMQVIAPLAAPIPQVARPPPQAPQAVLTIDSDSDSDQEGEGVDPLADPLADESPSPPPPPPPQPSSHQATTSSVNNTVSSISSSSRPPQRKVDAIPIENSNPEGVLCVKCHVRVHPDYVEKHNEVMRGGSAQENTVRQRMADINNKAICTHCGDSVPHD